MHGKQPRAAPQALQVLPTSCGFRILCLQPAASSPREHSASLADPSEGKVRASLRLKLSEQAGNMPELLQAVVCAVPTSLVW